MLIRRRIVYAVYHADRFVKMYLDESLMAKDNWRASQNKTANTYTIEIPI